MQRLKARLVRCIPAMLAATAIVVFAWLAIAWGQSVHRSDSRARLQNAAGAIVQQLDRVLVEYERLSLEIESAAAAHCSPQSLEHFRRYLFGLDYLRDIGFVDTSSGVRTLVCTTALGVIDKPRPSSAPDFTLPSAVEVYAFRPVRVSERRPTMVLQTARFNALVDPNLIDGWYASPEVDEIFIGPDSQHQDFALFSAQQSSRTVSELSLCSSAQGFCIHVASNAPPAGQNLSRNTGLAGFGAGSGLAIFLLGQTMFRRMRDPVLALRRAIARRELQAVYQPILRALDGSLVGVEVLARWPGAPEQLDSPEKFVAAAEAHGLIGRLTELMLETAAKELSDWLKRDGSRSVAINISALDLAEGSLLAMLDKYTVRRGIDASQVILEITERSVASPHQAQLERKRLRTDTLFKRSRMTMLTPSVLMMEQASEQTLSKG